MNDEIPLFTEREQERVLEGEPIGKAPKKDTRQALKNLQIWVSMAPNIKTGDLKSTQKYKLGIL